MDRGKVLHASFHFESRSSMALNAERVASIRPNETFVDARKENKRRKTKRSRGEDARVQGTSYKTVIDKEASCPAPQIVVFVVVRRRSGSV